ncbi:hypothetical protein J6590_039986 [Homalodisca vitripennis]|nr:hypothetical protein J6590_039986 [Homalodisca vitripennis]
METDLVNALAILQSPAFRSIVAKKQCLNRLLRRSCSVALLRPVETRYSGNVLQTCFEVLVLQFSFCSRNPDVGLYAYIHGYLIGAPDLAYLNITPSRAVAEPMP